MTPWRWQSPDETCRSGLVSCIIFVCLVAGLIQWTISHYTAWTTFQYYACRLLATGWTVRGSNPSGGGARFSTPVQTGPGNHPASYTMGTVSFPEVKLPGRGVYHTPPSSSEVKERVELYLYSPSGPSWSVLGWTVPLALPLLIPLVVYLVRTVHKFGFRLVMKTTRDK